ncbi:nitrilase-related carbon-nitrogen hydrolase [Sphingopyxis panaciterrulae]|uniref:Putative amidohydrolase n=1 Tax=Sphingopyxis panaciterrulae TaxID=462372 RepID=A0A7W9B6E7_9SPHN|nr:nitrilase-related carbon-nitrogen hydrolase [Sphingopyxis panaciterrulae]MBB5707058.1 putative amidohydrolase [Sphingopyxis panaciterrulae]
MSQRRDGFVRHDGTYETAPLRSAKVAVGIVQTPVRAVDGDNPEAGIRDNLAYMLNAIDKAQQTGGRCDLLCFHEFPLHGFAPWDLAQYLRVSRHPDGPEIQELGKKARQYNCYIAFGCQMLDDDWAGHTMNTQLLIAPTGELIARHWKQRNMRGMWPGVEQFTTTIYDVYDRYVEMYGLDAVIPVERTDIGNISLSSVQFEPELFRCMTLKGAEIILRTATGGCEWHDMRLTAYHNDVFVTIVNNSIDTFRPSDNYFVEQAPRNDWVGRSAIFGPKGVVLAEADKFETKRRAVFDMESYRKAHRIPDVHFSLYRHVYDDYRERYDPNMWLARVPETKRDAYDYLKDKFRWTSFWQG